MDVKDIPISVKVDTWMYLYITRIRSGVYLPKINRVNKQRQNRVELDLGFVRHKNVAITPPSPPHPRSSLQKDDGYSPKDMYKLQVTVHVPRRRIHSLRVNQIINF